MKKLNQINIGTIVIILSLCSYAFGQSEHTYQSIDECTIGVASGKATSDNRPLVWKSRDATAINNEIFHNKSGKYKYIAVVSSGYESYSWMGINEKGFAIVNSVVYDLDYEETGFGNGDIMING